MRLALVVDKSPSWTTWQRDLVLSRWGAADGLRKVSRLSQAGAETLFGDPGPCWMEATGTTDIKTLVADLRKSSKEPEVMERQLAAGLVVVSNGNLNSLRPLEKLVKDLGGQVVKAKESSKDRTSTTDKMLDTLNVSHEVRSFLKEYAGDDYELLLPVVKAVSTLPDHVQGRLGVHDMAVRLPQSEGSIPPWSVEDPLMRADVDGTLRAYRRVVLHSHPLVVLSLLKSKLSTAYKVAALTAAGCTLPQAAGVLGTTASAYPFRLAAGMAGRMGEEKCRALLETVVDLESKAKGGSGADLSAHMEAGLARMCAKISR